MVSSPGSGRDLFDCSSNSPSQEKRKQERDDGEMEQEEKEKEERPGPSRIPNFDEDADSKDMFDDSEENAVFPVAQPAMDTTMEDGRETAMEVRRMRYAPVAFQFQCTKVGTSVAGTSERGQDVRKLRSILLGDERSDEIFDVQSFGEYMHLKKRKLNEQVNELGAPAEADVISHIFRGVAIFVNGYTDPPALQLRQMVQANGGEFHVYEAYGRTTHIIATSLAAVKTDKQRKGDVIVRPAWIVDSVAAGRKLAETEYLLLSAKEVSRQQISRFFGKELQGCSTAAPSHIHPPTPATTASLAHTAPDARHPSFIESYYARSRLHLISTLAQEMKDWVKARRERATEEPPVGVQLIREAGIASGRLKERVVMHIDMDCFFVSVAMRSRPELRGKPVAITHSKGSSSAAGFSDVASCSYAARSAGVRNGMSLRDALRRCATLVCIPYEFDEYRAVSQNVYGVVTSFCLSVRAVSCDEMYVDATELLKEAGVWDAGAVAEMIRQRVKEATGCPASVGMGPNSLIARLATRHAKPDGVRWVTDSQVDGFMRDEKVSSLAGVGGAMLEKLSQMAECDTCGQLRQVERHELRRLLGNKMGEQLYDACRGRHSDGDDFTAVKVRKSVSCDINYGIRFTKREDLTSFVALVGQELEKKLSLARLTAATLTVKIMVRSADAPVETAKYMGHGKCDQHTRSAPLAPPTSNSTRLAEAALALIDKIGARMEELRGIGVQLTRLQSETEKKSRTEAINRLFKVTRRASQKSSEKKRPPSRAIHTPPIPECVESPASPVVDLVEIPPPEAPPTLPLAFCARKIERREVIEKMREWMQEAPCEEVVSSLTTLAYCCVRTGDVCMIRWMMAMGLRMSEGAGEGAQGAAWLTVWSALKQELNRVALEKWCAVLWTE